MRGPTRSHYKYIDDTGNVWSYTAVDYLAEAGNLEKIPDETPNAFPPLPPNYEPRHINLVAIQERPGMQKYRTEVVVNERDFSKFANMTMIVNEFEMRATRFVGEKRRVY